MTPPYLCGIEHYRHCELQQWAGFERSARRQPWQIEHLTHPTEEIAMNATGALCGKRKSVQWEHGCFAQ
jgi:hypothetical protein